MFLNLMTCNIRFDNPADGPNAWPYRRDFLSELLLSYSPDIIATQEGRHDQLKELEKLLGQYELVDQHRSWIKERMYPSFFIKKGVFEVLKTGDLWLSETPDIAGSSSFESAFPRLMTYLKVQPVNSDKNFLLVNTHFDHIKSETRIAQARVLLNEVKKLWKDNGSIVIMGDFNDAPESEVRKIIETGVPGIQDAWKKFHSVEETSHHAFKGEMQNGSRIDWLLIDKNLEVTSASMDKSKRGGLYPTDHFPVAATIKF